VQKHEAKVTPAVAKGVQFRLADPRVVLDRHFADAQAPLRGLQDHLGCELHPGRLELEQRDRRPPDRA